MHTYVFDLFRHLITLKIMREAWLTFEWAWRSKVV